MSNHIPLIYVLHSGQLYGTERMAIITIKGMSSEFQPILLTPPGLILAEAEKHGITTDCFHNKWELMNRLKFYLFRHQQVVFMTTSISHSLFILLWNLGYRRQVCHFHIVHGGANEYLSYARKLLLNYLPIKIIAVSKFVSDRLQHYGVRTQQIKVIENFLLNEQIKNIPKRKPFTRTGIKRVIVVSRLDPLKKIDLLLNTLDSFPELKGLEFRIFGFGQDLEKLQKRVVNHPQVIFEGFNPQILPIIANSDLLLHLCPVEPFGLVILEAMAVGIPVLVSNQGGTDLIVEHGISGFKFTANNEKDLALWLTQLEKAPAEVLNFVVENARIIVEKRFSERRGIAAYQYLLKNTNY